MLAHPWRLARDRRQSAEVVRRSRSTTGLRVAIFQYGRAELSVRRTLTSLKASIEIGIPLRILDARVE